MAGLAFASAVSRDEQGRITAASWGFGLVVSVGAWFADIPVAEAAGHPDASAGGSASRRVC